jgi:hypothetical protein
MAAAYCTNTPTAFQYQTFLTINSYTVYGLCVKMSTKQLTKKPAICPENLENVEYVPAKLSCLYVVSEF